MIINNIANINFGGGGGGGETAKLQEKSMTLSSATATIVPDAGYDGMTKVDVDATEYGTSNYNDGVLAQKAKLEDITITSNGTYAKEDGYNNVVVDVKVPTEIDLKTGIKFGNSTFSAVPYTLICDSGVTDMSSMFSDCTKLTSLDLSSFNTSNVTNMSNMFSTCNSLTTLDLSNFNTSNVTNMSNMFSTCNSLTTLDLSNFNTSNVINMIRMFNSCNYLTTLDVSNFDTSNVTNMNSMFNSCNSLTTLDVSNFDTSKVTSMYSMFAYSSELTTLDLSNFNTSNVTNMNSMFNSCNKLATVKVINCDETTKNKILTQLQSDLSSHTWTLGDNGIITRSEKTA